MLAAAVAPLTGSNETTIIVSVRLPACPRRSPTRGAAPSTGRPIRSRPAARASGWASATATASARGWGAGVGRGVGGSVGDGLGELAIATTTGAGRRTSAAAAVAVTSAATITTIRTRDRRSASRARLRSMPGRYHPRPHQTAVPTSWSDLGTSKEISRQNAGPRQRYGAAAQRLCWPNRSIESFAIRSMSRNELVATGCPLRWVARIGRPQRRAAHAVVGLEVPGDAEHTPRSGRAGSSLLTAPRGRRDDRWQTRQERRVGHALAQREEDLLLARSTG